MRQLLSSLLLAFSFSAHAAQPGGLMDAASVKCSAYLALPADSIASQKLLYWVSGRVVAIVEAPIQSFLRKQSLVRLDADLRDFCSTNDDEDMFGASAMIAYYYSKEAKSAPVDPRRSN